MCRDTRIDQGAGPVSVCCKLLVFASYSSERPSATRSGIFARSSIFPTPPKIPFKTLGIEMMSGGLPTPTRAGALPLLECGIFYNTAR